MDWSICEFIVEYTITYYTYIPDATLVFIASFTFYTGWTRIENFPLKQEHWHSNPKLFFNSVLMPSEKIQLGLVIWNLVNRSMSFQTREIIVKLVRNSFIFNCVTFLSKIENGSSNSSHYSLLIIIDSVRKTKNSYYLFLLHIWYG